MTLDPRTVVDLMAVVQQLTDRVEVLEKIVANAYLRDMRAMVEEERAALVVEQMKRAS